MKTKLIMLDTPIIVSDEKIKNGDAVYEDISGIFSPYEEGDVVENPRKIIAGIEGLPSIDWNGLEEEFGWVDVEKLANTLANEQSDDFIIRSHIYASFIEGFDKAQSLNDKKFSLEDMVNFLDFVIVRYPNQWKAYTARISKGFYSSSEILHEFIQSLQQPKVFDIEIETEEVRPKIVHNSIKIIKKLIPHENKTNTN